ncbi:hypothetical protein PWT90_10373 [Aphanocladium album]|nr:hypothetical protein PWT90_10373 [Aphanocladium album]
MYPLSPAHDANLNRSPSPRRYDDYEVRKYTMTAAAATTTTTMTTTHEEEEEDILSSPLISNTSALTTATARSNQQENTAHSFRPDSRSSVLSGGGAPHLSPAKGRRHSRVISGTELSPLKILSRKRSSEEALAGDAHAVTGSMRPPPARSARKMSSPEKRFPVKIGGVGGEDGGARRMMHERQVSLEDAMRRNGNLQHAIDIFEDDEEQEGQGEERKESGSERPPTATSSNGDASLIESAFNPDDSMASTFSTFSAAPTLTSYANWRAQQSPAKLAALAGVAGSSRPSTRDDSGNTTNLLMDFTDSLRHPRRASPEKKLPSSSTLPNLTAATATPNRANTTTTLIDFDIPPLPTPRSVPSISSRELESLKSGFLSEISSLKASLSGKEAEVSSLKTAVGDAEKRVGESMEKLREEAALREQAAAERDDWERRGREVEGLLRTLQDEVVSGQRERDEAERKLEESEKRREAAEILHQEAESKIAGLRAGKDSESRRTSPQQQNNSSKEVELAVERVARELHALYKGKHETKVTALKKSYEARWEKKVKELERKVVELREENGALKKHGVVADPDDTLLMAAQANAEADKEQASRDRVTIRELNASVQRLEAVVSSVQGDNAELRSLLERERVEKGELVQLAEEMMSMQQQQQQSFVGGKTPAPAARPAMPTESNIARTPGKPRPVSHQPTTSTATTPGRRVSVGSLSKQSGLRAPGSAFKSGMRMPGTGGGLGGRSGIMSSIEKMGNHRGRGQ